MRCRKTGRSGGREVGGGRLEWDFLRFSTVSYGSFCCAMGWLVGFLQLAPLVCKGFTTFKSILKHLLCGQTHAQPAEKARGTAILQCPKLRLPHSEGVSATQVN